MRKDAGIIAISPPKIRLSRLKSGGSEDGATKHANSRVNARDQRPPGTGLLPPPLPQSTTLSYAAHRKAGALFTVNKGMFPLIQRDFCRSGGLRRVTDRNIDPKYSILDNVNRGFVGYGVWTKIGGSSTRRGLCSVQYPTGSKLFVALGWSAGRQPERPGLRRAEAYTLNSRASGSATNHFHSGDMLRPRRPGRSRSPSLRQPDGPATD